MRLANIVVAGVLSIGSGVAWSDAPRTNFLLHCAGCHQSDGSGLPDGRVPSLTANVGYFLESPAGREFLVRVPGSSQSPLGDQDLADVLNWLLNEFSPQQTAHHKPYSASEVQELRKRPLDDVAGERRQVRDRLKAQGVDVR